MDLVNKYRPTKLSQVIGQEAAVAIIRGIVKRREEINPVTLFCGPHSTGKTTLAWLLALYTNCSDPQKDGEACRECESCENIIRAIRAGTDGRSVIEKPVGARGIDDIRSLESQAKYRCRDRYRWFIIDEAHNLTKPAFDAALRLFEKPPKQARFVLCTTLPEALPTTIQSRDWKYSLQTIDPEVTAKKLLWPINKREKFGLDQKTVMQIAKQVNGFPRDALNLLAQWAVAAESGIKPEDAPHMLGSLEAASQHEAIRGFCRDLLGGDLRMALYAVQFAKNPEYFIDRTIQLMQQIMYRWISPDMTDPSFGYDIKEIDPPTIRNEEKALRYVQGMGKVLGLCVDAQDRIKQYRCNNKAVLEALTIEVHTIMESWQ